MAKKRGQSKQVTMPVARGAVTKSSRPTSVNIKDGILVKHRERINTVHTYSTFTLTDYLLQPALTYTDRHGMFQWLPHIAARYEFYRFRSVTFEYVPQCATSTEGINAMMFDYDPSDPLPGSMESASRSADFVSYPAWKGASLTIPGRRITPQRKYTRQFMSNTTDLRMADAGRFVVLSDGGDDGYSGDLYVSYELELTVPQSALTTQAKATFMGGVFTSKSTPHPVSVGADDRVEIDTDLVIDGLASAAESLGIDATGTIGALRVAAGVWRAVAQGNLENTVDETTDLLLKLKRVTPVTEGDDTAAEAALDVTGSGADATILSRRFSYHSTASPTLGVSFTAEVVFYSNGQAYYAPYVNVTAPTGAVTLEDFRIALVPFH